MEASRESDPWVIRTDFSSDAEWSEIRSLISSPQQDGGMEFFAYVYFVDSEKFAGLEPHDVVLSLPNEYDGFFCFVVDRETIANPEHPILAIGFCPSDDRSYDRLPSETPPADVATFRALPSQIQGIENNLSIANMDFEDFADSVQADGIFRGFPR